MNNNLPATKDDLENAMKVLEAKMVTKDDAKQFLTKDDAKQFATKDDLKQFATKDDLKQFATKKELEHTERILRAEIRLSAESVKVELREDMKHMESRIIDHLDSFLAEVKASSEEREVVSYRLSDHEERLTKLETNHPISTPI